MHSCIYTCIYQHYCWRWMFSPISIIMQFLNSFYLEPRQKGYLSLAFLDRLIQPQDTANTNTAILNWRLRTTNFYIEKTFSYTSIFSFSLSSHFPLVWLVFNLYNEPIHCTTVPHYNQIIPFSAFLFLSVLELQVPVSFMLFPHHLEQTNKWIFGMSLLLDIFFTINEMNVVFLCSPKS